MKCMELGSGTIIREWHPMAESTGQTRQAQEVDAIPTLAWSARSDGPDEFLNRRWLDYTGLSAELASH